MLDFLLFSSTVTEVTVFVMVHGASFDFRCSALVELISLQRDWSSNAVLLYIAELLERRFSVAKLLARNMLLVVYTWVSVFLILLVWWFKRAESGVRCFLAP